MKIAIIGLPNSGKTTIFNVLTGLNIETTPYSEVSLHKNNIGVAKVIDERIEYLSSVFKPKKTTFTDVEFVDTAPLFEKGSTALQDAKNADALLLVVRGFENEEVLYKNKIDPISEIENIQSEMLISDLMITENRLSRLETQIARGRKELKPEQILFEKIKEILDSGTVLRDAELSFDEIKMLSGYQLASLKPLLIVVNVDEDKINDIEFENKIKNSISNSKSIEILFICGSIEEEIKSLPPNDAIEFMQSYGLEKSGLDLVISKSHMLLGLIAFFTVGPDEVRSWSIPKNITVQKAAGVIHSDLEKGFIRAEVTGYDNFKKYGNFNDVKANGLQQLEGKDYIVKDGDIINVRFNV